ncbi:Anti-sigma factor N-terminus [Mesobacillus persicus]|uniref:Anti-sigma factor N-terminus n=1 Tax=Mesobacillus persicus TaxID=930146 RepID=A0A1H8FNP9_9BACI|nr:anti-sigma factor domain-containing protein [Mesobacillus persicus]SEN33441.1 Anti-sigma factor N-terminus [Mesobacillus persicus]
MRKGVVLDIEERYVTLLTPDGQFMRSRKLSQEYQKGEEIYFIPVEVDHSWKSRVFPIRNKLKVNALILTAVMMVLAVALYPIFENRQVYAYMSIDVNPSIELELNDSLNVISMKGYNREGENIINQLKDWKKENAVLVAKKVLDEMEEQGYLENQKRVLIGTVPSEEESNSELEETLTEIKKVTEAEQLELTVVTATEEERSDAIKQGITSGTFKQKNEGIIEKDQSTPSQEKVNTKDKQNNRPVKEQEATKGNPSRSAGMSNKSQVENALDKRNENQADKSQRKEKDKQIKNQDKNLKYNENGNNKQHKNQEKQLKNNGNNKNQEKQLKNNGNNKNHEKGKSNRSNGHQQNKNSGPRD